MEKIPLVIYHGKCQDGFTAAWVFWKNHPTWEFYPATHGGCPPDVTNRVVYMLDFSYKRPVIIEMASKAAKVHIIDHHKTAEADLIDLPDNVSVVFDMKKSGAMLAWDYINIGTAIKDRPMLIDYVQDRDLWKFQFPETKALSTFFFSLEYTFENWDSLEIMMNSRELITTARQQGEAILRKQDKDVLELCENKFKINICGYTVWTVNLPYTLCSDAGMLLCKGESFASTFYYNGTNFVFSLRSDENGIDVSEIAKYFGGGGHKHAAGFEARPSACSFLFQGTI